MMKKNFMRLASVLMCMAFGCLPLAGQEKAVMKTGAGEYVPKQSVQLRAAVPSDSSIAYSPKGEFIYKYVTMREDGDYHSTKRHKWENNRWMEDETVPDLWDIRYQHVYYIGAPEVIIEEGEARFYIPTVVGWIWWSLPDQDYEAKYDSKGNLTELYIVGTRRYVFLYDELNRVVAIDNYLRTGILTNRYRYEYYADTPYRTLFECLNFDEIKGQWVAHPFGKHVRTVKPFQREDGSTFQQVLSDEQYVADANGNWAGDKKYNLTYDSNGREVSEYHYVWYGNRWTQVMYIVFYPNTLVPNVDAGDNDPVDDTNKGDFDIIIKIPADSIADGSFVIKLPDGYTLDETDTRLHIDFGDFTLVITKQEDNSWLLEIRPKGTRSAALRSEDVTRVLAHIAYTVDGHVRRGTYDITVHSIQFETPGGDAVVEPALTVPVRLNRWGVGSEAVAASDVWSAGSSLHVRTAQPATLNVYTLSGALFHRQTLPAGETTVPLPQGTYIVKVGNVSKKLLITN